MSTTLSDSHELAASSSSNGSHPPILRLSRSARSLLRSTAHLPSLPSLLVELVYNALDAGGRTIEVTVDLAANSISCRDDGNGFHAALLVGGSYSREGYLPRGVERYVTTNDEGFSDSRGQARYGLRGEALANMAAVGLLYIETSLRGPPPLSGQRWTLIQKGEQAIFSGLTSKWRDDIDCGRTRCNGDAALVISAMGSSQGTEVAVRDLYRDVPLRRPSRLDEAGRRSLLEACRKAMLEVALREPSISFTLKTSPASNIGTSFGSVDRTLLRCPRVTSLAERFRSTTISFCNDDYECISFTHVLCSTSDQVGSASAVFRGRGMFLLAPQTSKAHQYIYVQGRRCQADIGLGEFLSSIGAEFRIGTDQSNLLQSGEASCLPSSIRVKVHAPGRPHSAVAKGSRTLGQTITATVAKGFGSGEVANLVRPDGPKRFERKTARNGHPSFLFDLWLESKGPSDKTFVDETDVNRILEEEVERVLQEKGLISFSRRGKGTVGTSAMGERRPATSSSLQVQRSSTRVTPRPRTTANSTSVQPRPLPLIFPASLKPNQGAADSSRRDSAKPKPGRSRSREGTPEGHIRYIDASSHKTYFVDQRTGNSRLASSPLDVEANVFADDGGTTQSRKRLRKTWVDSDENGSQPASAPAPAWLSQVLQKWDNPALPTQAEPAISSVDLLRSLREAEGGEAADDEMHYGRRSRKRSALPIQVPRQTSMFFTSSPPASASAHLTHACHDGPISSIVEEGGSLLGADVSKLSLQSAHVIAQVSTKFILCVVPDGRRAPEEPGKDLLVCIDQHAADERVRFESILEEYVTSCQARSLQASHTLKKPVELWLPSNMAEELIFHPLSTRCRALSFWGFGVASTTACSDGIAGAEGKESEPKEAKVVVTHVPAPLAERLRTEKATLEAVLRSFFDEEIPLPLPSSASLGVAKREEHQWTLALRHLPPRLLDLFRSKACRGAIMFNDPLKPEQCRRLVGQLARSTFPFQCAHGRQGLVPLCSLPGSRVGKSAASANRGKVDVQGGAHRLALPSGVGRPRRRIDWKQLQ